MGEVKALSPIVGFGEIIVVLQSDIIFDKEKKMRFLRKLFIYILRIFLLFRIS